jgi:hypothetical protein
MRINNLLIKTCSDFAKRLYYWKKKNKRVSMPDKKIEKKTELNLFTLFTDNENKEPLFENNGGIIINKEVKPKEVPINKEQSKKDEFRPKAISVSELNRIVQDKIEGIWITGVWVIAEIRDFKIHSSGHWYFSMLTMKA